MLFVLLHTSRTWSSVRQPVPQLDFIRHSKLQIYRSTLFCCLLCFDGINTLSLLVSLLYFLNLARESKQLKSGAMINEMMIVAEISFISVQLSPSNPKSNGSRGRSGRLLGSEHVEVVSKDVMFASQNPFQGRSLQLVATNSSSVGLIIVIVRCYIALCPQHSSTICHVCKKN